MPKLTADDLIKIRKKARDTINLRKGTDRAKITVHMGTCGIASGANDIMEAVLQEIETRNIKDIIVTSSGCAGFCSKEPMATVDLPGKPPVKYVELTKEKIIKIFSEHILDGKIVDKFALAIGSERIY
ncbi:NADP oxidoreductase [candidate division KSB1 bacterium 4572_119]|nr:MAG: NADP oxidoreductase [candidate division KSB1 bacterium 4572_119]